ncbi:MAG: SMP-30/gluconolactonase/LRE family protein [Sphingobium sp.]|nr:SMP-30/gluconolactonase/LRE family protein [Sphingobium sp.]
MTVQVIPVWKADCLLGEGPVWDERTSRLWFVDIKGGRLHSYYPDKEEQQTIETGGNPSFVVLTEDGRLITGSRHEIRHVDENGFGPLLALIDQPAGNRTNDATVDAMGRLWIATMDDAEQSPTGTIWCYNMGTITHAGTQAVVTNGPAVSADLQWLYHVNSGERQISRHQIGHDGKCDKGESFIQLTEEEGYPDGIILDSESCLWVALWDGWGVRRYSPEGELLLHIPLPCARVTKIAFGGPDMKTAYVTTARIGLDEQALADQPLAGALFSFRAPVAGLPLPRVRL